MEVQIYLKASPRLLKLKETNIETTSNAAAVMDLTDEEKMDSTVEEVAKRLREIGDEMDVRYAHTKLPTVQDVVEQCLLDGVRYLCKTCDGVLLMCHIFAAIYVIKR
ncbi:uncharacterized protein LOC144449278 [Glandiceps talaboti]